MIKIKRGQCPTCLNKPPRDFVEGDCNKEDVKIALLEMQNQKCCYCERSLTELGSVEKEVEHFIPKSILKNQSGIIQWNLANKWENLLYSCRTCNSGKGFKPPFNKTTGELEIIDPSYKDIDPEEYIDFLIVGSFISFKASEGRPLGKSTIEKLKLYERTDLFGEFRKIRAEIEKVFMELINALVIDNVAEFEQKKNELSASTSAHIPFAAFHRKYITKRLKELNEKELSNLEMQYGIAFDKIEIDLLGGYSVIST